MIKPAEGDDKSLLFARPGDCATWAKIPVEQIQDIEYVRLAHCGGHTHPLVHVTMREPESDEGKAFAALASLHHAPLPAASAPMLGMAAAAPPGATPCYWDWTARRWICPP
jgi:hypothetical protein